MKRKFLLTLEGTEQEIKDKIQIVRETGSVGHLTVFHKRMRAFFLDIGINIPQLRAWQNEFDPDSETAKKFSAVIQQMKSFIYCGVQSVSSLHHNKNEVMQVFNDINERNDTWNIKLNSQAGSKEQTKSSKKEQANQTL